MAQNKRTKEEYTKIAEEIREEYANRLFKIKGDETGISFDCCGYTGAWSGTSDVTKLPSYVVARHGDIIIGSVKKYNLQQHEVVVLYPIFKQVSNITAKKDDRQ